MIATEYCNNVFDGTHDTPKPCSTGTHKLLTSKNILNGELDKTDAYYISDEDYIEINRRSKVHQWDVLFSMIGTVGNVCLVTDPDVDYAIKNMGDFSCLDERKARWLYYYLQSPYAKKLIQNYLNGAIQKFLPLGWLRELDIPECTDNSMRIVSVLDAIDSKIKLNKSICDDLMSIMKEIFKYWFVQFDFPDKNGKPYKTSGGKMVWNSALNCSIPKEWSCKTIDEVASRVKVGFVGTVDKYYCNQNEGYPIIRPAEMGENGIDYTSLNYITREFYEKNQKSQVHKGDIIISRCGKDGIPNIYELESKAQVLNAVIIEPNREMADEFFLSEMLKSDYSQKQIKFGTSGSVQGVINTSMIASIKFAYEREVCNKYAERITPCYERITSIRKENIQLTELRDFLLPMLMNGQISFEDD